jgi:predicted membrane protein
MNFSSWAGTGSSTRVHMTALIAFVIGAGVVFGIATHQKKFSIEQFDSFLSSGSAFIVTTCGPLYGANKVADYLKNKNSQPGA